MLADAFQGGSAWWNPDQGGSGGGGAGLYGGAAGNNEPNNNGGAGGSAFACGEATSVDTEAGSTYFPGGLTDPLYPGSPCAEGGVGAVDGGDGAVVLKWAA